VLVEVLNHIVEVATVVVDDGPAESPARQGIDLGDCPSTDDGDLLLQVAHGGELSVILVDQPVIDLIRNYGDLVIVGDLQNLDLMSPFKA
jgi:hypothetical protein